MTPQQAKQLGFKYDKEEEYWYEIHGNFSFDKKELKKLTVHKYLAELTNRAYNKGWDAKSEEIRRVLELD